jgi:hypothetical protein
VNQSSNAGNKKYETDRELIKQERGIDIEVADCNPREELLRYWTGFSLTAEHRDELVETNAE